MMSFPETNHPVIVTSAFHPIPEKSSYHRLFGLSPDVLNASTPRLWSQACYLPVARCRLVSGMRLNALDWVNLFLADVRGGLGVYVNVYLLTKVHWSQAAIQ
jgi:hypothetical protein